MLKHQEDDLKQPYIHQYAYVEHDIQECIMGQDVWTASYFCPHTADTLLTVRMEAKT